jgi:mono/diheme cytochrome c family protein
MKIKITIVASLLALFSVICGMAQPRKKETSSALSVYTAAESDAMRIDGEQRFRANCGRCHAAPHKFPPRMMSTIVRHMRVRATITDEDMRRIVYYMTQ